MSMKATPKQNVLAVILAIGILTAVGVRIWAFLRIQELIGPDCVAAQGNVVCIHLNHSLCLLSAAGELHDNVPLSRLGMRGCPADLQVLDDGNILIGDPATRTILRCDLSNGSAPLCRVIGPSLSNVIAAPFKFFLDEYSAQLYIADTTHHRVLVQDMAGRGVREIADGKRLRFPNGIRVGPDGLVRIADTNHHRVIVLDGHDPKDEATGLMLRADTKEGRPGRIWPVALTHGPNMDWWVVNADGALKNADLVVYDAEGQPERRVVLPNRARPAFIAFTGESMVVTDEESAEVYAVAALSGLVEHFGDAAFREKIRKFRESRNNYQRFFNNSLHAVVALSLAGFGLAISLVKSHRKKQSSPYRPEASPSSSILNFTGVHWLEPDQRILGRLRKINWIVIGSFTTMLTAGCAVLLVLLAFGVRKKGGYVEIIVMVIMMAVLNATVIWSTVRTHRRLLARLGSDGKQLFLADYRGKVVQTLPEEIVYTESRIAFGRSIVFTQVGITPLFPQGEFEQHIRQLLNRAQRIGILNMAIYHITAFKTFEILWFILMVLDFVAILLWLASNFTAY